MKVKFISGYLLLENDINKNYNLKSKLIKQNKKINKKITGIIIF